VLKHCSDIYLAVSVLAKTGSLYGSQIQYFAELRNVLLPPQTSNKIVLVMAV